MELKSYLEKHGIGDGVERVLNPENDPKNEELKLVKTFEKVFCGDQIICIKGNFPAFFLKIPKLI